MPEVAERNLVDAQEIPQGMEIILDPNGVDRIQTPHGLVTVMKGVSADGKPGALVFGVDCPPELVLGDDDASKADSAFQRLRRHPLAQLVAGIGYAAASVAGIAACTPDSGLSNPDNDEPSFRTQTGALTTTKQIEKIGKGQPVPWSQPGDGGGNFAKIGNEKYLILGGVNNVKYVKCDQVENCLSQGQPKNIIGLVGNPGGPLGPYGSPGIYQDAKGASKFFVHSKNEWGDPETYLGDVNQNPDGDLVVNNLAPMDPPILGTSDSVFPINNVPHVLTNYGQGPQSGLYNLHTKQQGTINLSSDVMCGSATFDGAVAIGAKATVVQGVTWCQLVFASTLEGLAKGAPITILNQQQPSHLLNDPRMMDNVLVYAVGNPPKLWYALIPPATTPQPDPAPDASGETAPETSPAAGDADVVDLPPDAVVTELPPDVPPDVPPDLPPDVSSTVDSTTPPPDVEPPKDVQPVPVDAPDATELPKDVAAPEVTPTPCDFAKAKINVKVGNCDLEKCQDPLVDITGKCTVEIDLGKAKPVILEVDGKYNVDLLEQIGALLIGKFKVTDNGNKFGTVIGNHLIAVEGTKYLGELPDDTHFSVSCEEGKITIYLVKQDGKKELLATLNAGQNQSFDMKNPQPEAAPDAGQPDTSGADASQAEPDQTDATATQPEVATPKPDVPAADVPAVATKDGGSTGPETAKAADTTKTQPQDPKTVDPGCVAAKGAGKSGHEAVAGLALFALAYAFTRRSRRSKLSKAA